VLFLNYRSAILTGVMVLDNFVVMIAAATKDRIVVLSMAIKDVQT